MKRTSVVCAAILLEPGADPAAPGGAVTRALCGSWDHAGACRWPHQTSAVPEGGRAAVRVVFVAAAEDEDRVRALIERALTSGECSGPDGKRHRWAASDVRADVLRESEEALGARIAASRPPAPHA